MVYQNELDILNEKLENGEISYEEYDWELTRIEEQCSER